MSNSGPRGCRSVITLDYDIDYEIFKLSLYDWVRERARKLGGHLACWPSSGGNTHCSMCLESELSEIERLAYETLFLDDPIRIIYNFERLLEWGKLHDRLFLSKAVTRVLYGASYP